MYSQTTLSRTSEAHLNSYTLRKLHDFCVYLHSYTTTNIPAGWPERPSLFFREQQRHPLVDGPDIDSADETGVRDEKPIVCRRCRMAITASRHAMAVNGKHFHTFFNPAGVVYEIRCFRRASGCHVHGRSSDEFTWFPGYSWHLCLCSICLTHLGWFFSSPGSAFYGLIRQKLDGE